MYQLMNSAVEKICVLSSLPLRLTKTRRYGYSILITLLVIAVSGITTHFLGFDDKFIPIFGLVAINSWLGGLGPGMLTVLLSIIWLFAGNNGRSPFDKFHTAVFILEALLISSLNIARLRVEQERASMLAYAEQARQAAEEAQQAAEKANKSKDQFLAFVSHELRTPLTAILGWTRLQKSGKLDANGMTAAIDTIERNAKLQAQLIQDLLDISRIISGKLHVEMHPIDLVSVLQAAVDAVYPTAQAKSISLQSDFTDSVLMITGDAMRLQQVVWNLLTNAIKFTAAGGKVEIKALYLESFILISVSDNGIGIDAKLLPYVFDRFIQAEGSQAAAGLGLGLAIVRHIVEIHGGTIQAYSEGAAKGATFTIKLPVLGHTLHEAEVDLAEPEQDLTSHSLSHEKKMTAIK